MALIGKRLLELAATGRVNGFDSGLADVKFDIVRVAAAITDADQLTTKDYVDGAISGSGAFIPIGEKGNPSGVATLDAYGKLTGSEIPAIAITDTFVVASEAAMLLLATAEQGDVAVRTDLSKSFILVSGLPSVVGNWQELLTPASPVSSVAGRVGAVTLDTSDVAEHTNYKYFTEARVRSTVLTGMTGAGLGTVLDTDSVLTAFRKLENRTALNDAKVGYTASGARADVLASSITNGDVTHAPDGNSVYDALALKSDVGHGHVAADISDFDTAAKAAAVVDSMAGTESDQAPSVSSLKGYLGSEPVVAGDAGVINNKVYITNTSGVLFERGALVVCQGLGVWALLDTASYGQEAIGMVIAPSGIADGDSGYVFIGQGPVKLEPSGLSVSNVYWASMADVGQRTGSTPNTPGNALIFIGRGLGGGQLWFAPRFVADIES